MNTFCCNIIWSEIFLLFKIAHIVQQVHNKLEQAFKLSFLNSIHSVLLYNYCYCNKSSLAALVKPSNIWFNIVNFWFYTSIIFICVLVNYNILIMT